MEQKFQVRIVWVSKKDLSTAGVTIEWRDGIHSERMKRCCEMLNIQEEDDIYHKLEYTLAV